MIFSLQQIKAGVANVRENYEDINKEIAVRGLLSRLHPRITHYNRIII